MSNIGQAQYLRVFDDASTYNRWQSYYVGQTVTLDSQQWIYYPFVVNGFIGGSPGGGSEVVISVPATALAISLFEEALSENYLVEINIYEFDTRLTQAQPQSGQLSIGVFVGEVVGISGTFATIDVALGSSLAPVGAQIPPRNFTSVLIGAPLQL